MSLESIIGASAPFLNTFYPKLDEKGRLLLPAKFRTRLAPGVVITKGQERCLYLYPMDEFARFYEELSKAPVTDKKARDFLRVLLAGANDDIPDKQGRLPIPPHLREYAGLERELTVIGVGNHVEVWDRAAWDNYLPENEDAYADTAAQILPGLGI